MGAGAGLYRKVADSDDNTLILKCDGQYRKKGVHYLQFSLDKPNGNYINEGKGYWETEHIKTFPVRWEDEIDHNEMDIRAMNKAKKLFPNNNIVWKEDYYQSHQPIQDGLWSGIKKLFGGGKRRGLDAEYEVGDKIKFERRNGQNANGVIENVYYNDEEGGIDYGVRSTRSTDNIVVPQENIIDSHAASVLTRCFPSANPDKIADFIMDGWNARLSDSANVRNFKRLTI